MSDEEQRGWLELSAGVRTLDDRAIIEVAGDDAHEWLQGQITNQIEGVETGSSVYGFVLTLKGRVLADVWVLVREQDFWLDVPKSQVAALLERLDRYIIMEDVDLERRDNLRLVTAQGPLALQIDGGWPEDRLGFGGKVWVFDDNEGDHELGRIRAEAVAFGGGELDADAWDRAHVVFGRPRFGIDFGEHTYPQESGLAGIAVSFNKGCYIGQETVVMLENRGKAPKVLWRWEVEGSAVPDANAAITKDGTEVGEVTSAAGNNGSAVALGYLKRGHDADLAGAWAIGGRRANPLGPVAATLGLAKR